MPRQRPGPVIPLVHEVDVEALRDDVPGDPKDALNVAVPHVVEAEGKHDEDGALGGRHAAACVRRRTRPDGNPSEASWCTMASACVNDDTRTSASSRYVG